MATITPIVARKLVPVGIAVPAAAETEWTKSPYDNE